jgi:CubicO group peptidase (beta-lactamase class C family)
VRRRKFGSLLGGTLLAPLAAYADDEDKSVDRAALDRMSARLAISSNVHSVLVACGGRLVFERYFSGPDEIHDRRVRDTIFDAGILHDMKSVSKAIASLCVGIAIDRGLIAGVDQPLLGFFPEYADLHSPENDRLTLAHALTMSLGRRWVEPTPETGNYDNDEARMNMAPDSCRYVLGLPIVAPPGHEFFYNTGALAFVSAIVRKATGRPLDEFARETVFDPLGIAPLEWKRVKGETDAGGGLRLRPRDMVKIGQLVLAGGDWNGRRIVSKAWIDASTAPRLKASAKYDYGYLWWLGHDPRVFAALGRGGQSIRIVPELDLVVAVTAGYYQDYSPQAFALQAGIFTDVLSALRG